MTTMAEKPLTPAERHVWESAINPQLPERLREGHDPIGPSTNTRAVGWFRRNVHHAYVPAVLLMYAGLVYGFVELLLWWART